MVAGPLLWLCGALFFLAGLAIMAMGFGLFKPILPEVRGWSYLFAGLIGFSATFFGLTMMVLSNMAQELRSIRRLISDAIDQWERERARARKEQVSPTPEPATPTPPSFERGKGSRDPVGTLRA